MLEHPVRQVRSEFRLSHRALLQSCTGKHTIGRRIGQFRIPEQADLALTERRRCCIAMDKSVVWSIQCRLRKTIARGGRNLKRESETALVSGFNVPAEIGSSLEDIDTPALIIELDAFERNVERMATFVKQSGVRLRAHAKTHKSADIASYQMEE